MNHSLYHLRQAAAELLAYAICDLFPGVQLVESCINEFGFFYDFVAEQPIDAYAIPLIEEKMKAFSKEDKEIRSLAMMRENAADLLRHHEQDIKADIAVESPENIVSICQIGEFYDYCPALTVATTSEVKFFKILKIEKTLYRRGEWEDLNVIRIRGTAFSDPKSLKKFVKTVEASKKRDHRLLIKEMNLCSQDENSGMHEWFWSSRGTTLLKTLRDWWYSEHQQQGFSPITTPSFVKTSFLKKIGESKTSHIPILHTEHSECAILPSRSPLHALHFHANLHSYRELPVRYAECARVCRSKKEGELWGLFNTSFVEADCAHIFCSIEQVEKEVISSLQFIDKITKILGFEHYWCLGERGQKSAGTLRQWESINENIYRAFTACNLSFVNTEEISAFAGPVLQAYLVDALGREWKGPCLAIDFNYPERLGLRYQAQTGEMKVPIMMVRSLFGSLERFVALLIEHFAGALPLWLAPEQMRVISVGDKCRPYAESIWQTLSQQGYRVEADYRPEQLGKKIHQAEDKKVPYMIIIGDKEEKQNLLTVRSGFSDKIEAGVTLESFLLQVEEEIKAKRLSTNNGSTKYRR